MSFNGVAYAIAARFKCRGLYPSSPLASKTLQETIDDAFIDRTSPWRTLLKANSLFLGKWSTEVSAVNESVGGRGSSLFVTSCAVVLSADDTFPSFISIGSIELDSVIFAQFPSDWNEELTDPKFDCCDDICCTELDFVGSAGCLACRVAALRGVECDSFVVDVVTGPAP